MSRRQKTCRRTVRTRTGQEIARMIKAGRPVVVQYASPGCSACHETNPHIDAAAEQLCDVDAEIVRINTDTNEDFTDRMGIEELPTVQAWRGGKVVAQTAGADEAKFFAEFIRKAFSKGRKK